MAQNRPFWPLLGPLFGPFWPFWAISPKVSRGHLRGPKIGGPRYGHFWGPLVTGSGPFWFDNEILGIEAPGHQGPQGPDLGPFWDPFWEAPFQVVP